MIFGALRGNGLIENIIFKAKHISNRDSCFAPYIALREGLSKHSIQLDTLDKSNKSNLLFEIHQDVQLSSCCKINYLLMLENPLVKPLNHDPNKWTKYKKIFTWHDELVSNDRHNRFVKINLPNPINSYPVDGFSKRNRFCCLIAANKTLPLKDARDLYPERVVAIRWFEKNASKDFDLYGIDWNIPVVHRGLIGKLERRFWRLLVSVIPTSPFPSYRGKVANKSEVLTQTRFAICYENVRDLPGYITEKIFDCFFSGCVPVYWGADNITDYIPADCFIDRRNFCDTAAVYDFLKKITDQEFCGYQQRIADFLQSDASYPFSSEYFAETIVDTIVQDLGV
jgi:hypothetical protein